MLTVWIWLKRVVTIMFLGLLASNVLLPAVARAQFAASAGATVTQILAALVGQTVTAERYIATASSGTAYDTTSVLDCSLDLGPGANNCLGTDASGRNIIGYGAGTAEVWIGEAGSVTLSENGVVLNTNGAYICRNSCVLTNDFGTEPLKVSDANGLAINSTTAVKGFVLTAVTINVGNIAATTCTTQAATVAGVEANDFVDITPNFDMSGASPNVIVSNCRVTNAATDEVTCKWCNAGSAGNEDPDSGSYLFFVIR